MRRRRETGRRGMPWGRTEMGVTVRWVCHVIGNEHYVKHQFNAGASARQASGLRRYEGDHQALVQYRGAVFYSKVPLAASYHPNLASSYTGRSLPSPHCPSSPSSMTSVVFPRLSWLDSDHHRLPYCVGSSIRVMTYLELLHAHKPDSVLVRTQRRTGRFIQMSIVMTSGITP